MKILSFAIILFFMFLALNAQNITNIDLTQVKFEEVPADRIFEDIKFVPLETHKDGLLTMKSTFYLTDKYIVAVTFLKGAYLFDRETGAFVREVSSFGQGPDQYQGFIYHRSGFDEKHNILFANDPPFGKTWKGINIETNKVESIFKKSLPENDKSFSATAPWLIKDNIYVSFCNNRTGKDKIRLIVFDSDGNIIKKYPNYLEYDKGGSMSMPADNGIFYYYNERTYFKEWNYNDTVFCVDEKSMLPHIVFKLGNKQPSYYHQNNSNYNKGKYLINFVHESNTFILFSFTYYTEIVNILGETSGENISLHTGYYDKKSKQTYISSTRDYKKSGYAVTGVPVSFSPISINKSNEMVALINPEELIMYKDRIDSKFKHIFRNIQEDDNPILIIAKLKN